MATTVSPPRPHTGRRLTNDRTVWWVSFVLFACLGGIWAIATPLMASPDEPTHAARAAAVVRGEWWGREHITKSDDPQVLNRSENTIDVPAAYAELPSVPSCYAFYKNNTAACAPPISDSTELTETTTYVGTYPPLYYVLVGWPSRIFAPHAALYVMRLMSALVAGAFFASGLVAARRADRSGVLAVGAAVAATPMVLFMAGTINPSGFEIATAFATLLALLELVRGRGRPTTRTLSRVLVAGAALALARPLSVVMLGVIVVVVVALALRRPRWTELAADHRVRWSAAVGGVTVAISAAWVLATRSFDAFMGFPLPGLTTSEAIRHSFSELPYRVSQMIGVLGWFDTRIPRSAMAIWLGALALLVIVALVVGTWRHRGVLLGLIAIVVVMPTASEALRASSYGYIWQGRYSLPVSIGVPIVAAAIIGWSGRLTTRAVAISSAIVLGLLAVAEILAHAASMRRYVVGASEPLFSYLGAEGWTPPVPAALLLVVTVVLSVVTAIWLWHLVVDGVDERAVDEHAADRIEPSR